ncbi:MAG: SAM-dependent methyltransferase [Polyangiaceae bacterium]|nr:SAM-dependent methyltransferase [Polyangiaceae bacterium]
MHSDNRRSTTAEGTAVCRALGALEPSSLRNPDHLAHHFVTRPLWRACLSPLLRDLARGEIERRVPGAMVLHHVRTRLFDRLLLDAVRAGASQVLLLGAGGDSRAHRFRAELEGIPIFEADHPSTSVWKQARVRAMLGDAVDPVHYVPVDFERDGLAAALRRAGFDEGRATFALWEGVTMYLQPAVVDRTLRFLSTCAPGSSVAFDYLHAEALTHPERFEHAPLHVRYVVSQGEPFTFGLPSDPAGVASFLSARGLSLARSWHPEALRAFYPGRGTLVGFFSIALATKPF